MLFILLESFLETGLTEMLEDDPAPTQSNTGFLLLLKTISTEN